MNKRSSNGAPVERIHPVLAMLLLRLVIDTGLCATDVVALLGMKPNCHVRSKRTNHVTASFDRAKKLHQVMQRMKNTVEGSPRGAP